MCESNQKDKAVYGFSHKILKPILDQLNFSITMLFHKIFINNTKNVLILQKY